MFFYQLFALLLSQCTWCRNEKRT